MNNLRMAESYLNQAGERLKHAEEALQRGNYPYVMRQSQEVVELSLKAALRVAGIEPPKWHDVGPILMQNRDRFQEWFKDKIRRSHLCRGSSDVSVRQVCMVMRRQGYRQNHCIRMKTLKRRYPTPTSYMRRVEGFWRL